MATADTVTEEDALREYLLVDADSHVDEDLEDLAPYIEDTSPGVMRFLTGASNIRSEVYSSTRTTPPFNQTSGGEDGVPGSELVHDASTPDHKLELMRRFGIDYSVLTPGMNLNLATVNHDQTALALGNAYNSWLLDSFLDASDSLRANVLVAPQHPSRAAEEIDRVGHEPGFVGVQLPASGLVPPAGHHSYDPIYDAAADHDLPVVLHSGNSGAASVFPVQRTWAETFMEDHAFTFPVEAMWHLISVVCRGILERYPSLSFVVQEGGVEWLPWMLWRLDDHYLQNSQDVPILERYPSEYIIEQFAFTTQPLGHTTNTRHLACVLEAAGGSDTVVFASDHPHPDFDPPEEVYQPLSGHFEDDELRGIMGETAREIFGLP